jgi:phosphotransferase family enzyme
MKPTTDLPDDPALPGLVAIRAAGLAGAMPALGLGEGPVELLLCGYTPGSRVTLEARAGDRHFAVKAYADDPGPEVVLYQAFAAAALAGTSRSGVPQLLAWESGLRLLAISWLDGMPANRLIKAGQGQRAGELAARWLWRAASFPIKLGPPLGPGDLLYQVGKSVAELGAADHGLGVAAKTVAVVLKRAQPKNGYPRLVHGTLYARHILDLGDGPGVIDWQRFGQGPIEIDAGMFLATLSRLGLRHDGHASEARRAETAFLAETRGLLDERTLAWYRAAALVHLASRLLRRQPPPEASALLDEAARHAERAAVAAAGPRVSPAPPIRRSALELVLAALSSRPATPEELEQIRKLLDDRKGRTTS